MGLIFGSIPIRNPGDIQMPSTFTEQHRVPDAVLVDVPAGPSARILNLQKRKEDYAN